jgi:flap endonuclease-1
MGVDLRDLVSPVKVRLEELGGRVLAIDAYNALHQFLAIIRSEAGEPLMDRERRVTSHLSGLFYRTVNLLSLGIKPVYVLDGEPPSRKVAEIERRRAIRRAAITKYARALERGDLPAARKHAQATGTVQDYMVEDTKRILSLLGVPWLEAPSEGEATAAYLTTIDRAWAAASQDFDSLLFGAQRLIRNVTISGRRKLPGRPVYVDVQPEIIELGKVLAELGITREQLVDLGILLGTDFNPDGIPGVGPVKALKLIRAHRRLEEMPETHGGLTPDAFQEIRDIFLRPKPVAATQLQWTVPDRVGLIEFLVRERDFSAERIDAALEKLATTERAREGTLERWLS